MTTLTANQKHALSVSNPAPTSSLTLPAMTSRQPPVEPRDPVEPTLHPTTSTNAVEVDAAATITTANDQDVKHLPNVLVTRKRLRVNDEYRRILSNANKLETIQSNLESVIDFFLEPIVPLCSQLCEDCLKLMFECDFKLEFFRAAEDLVWKRVYHGIYRLQKANHKRLSRQEEVLVESHFVTGLGFYSCLIVRLRKHFQIHDVSGVLMPLNLNLSPIDDFAASQSSNVSGGPSEHMRNSTDGRNLGKSTVENPQAKQWAKQAIYRSLIYLGDLARYLMELSQFNYRQLAFRFYRSASRYQPEQGLPFNQLATLAGDLNHNLDAVCNYMRCCMRPKPFGPAEGNMRKLFDLNHRQFYETLRSPDKITSASQVYASKEPGDAAESLVRSVILTFIKVVAGIWSMQAGDEIVEDNPLQKTINNETTLFFELLREALELEPIVPLADCLKKSTVGSEAEKEFCPISDGSDRTPPKYVSPSVMYEFCNISIMLTDKFWRLHVSKCKDNNSGAESKLVIESLATVVDTLALNLLHYATSKCHKMVTSKLLELRLAKQANFPMKTPTLDRHQTVGAANENRSMFNSTGDLSLRSFQSTDTLNSSNDAARRALSRMRQKKAASKYTDIDPKKPLGTPTIATQINDDADMSELEDTALSTIDALEISSDMSEDDDYHVDDLIDFDSSSTNDDNSLRVCRASSEVLGCVNEGRPISRPTCLRPTKSHNYEHEKSRYPFHSDLSLRTPDLMTGLSKFSAANDKSSHLIPTNSDKKNPKTQQNPPFETASTEMVYAFLYTRTYLPSIKILFDWLLSNVSIINDNRQSFLAFSKELNDLVSLLNELRRVVGANNSDIVGATDDSPGPLGFAAAESVSLPGGNLSSADSIVLQHGFNHSWVQKYPLSCDYPLVNLKLLKGVHDMNIDFSFPRAINDAEAGFITTQCVAAFASAMSALLYNATEAQ